MRSEGLRVAYADPPYEGQARKHYGKNGDTFCGDVAEVDHAALIERLCDEFPDGWALSCKTASLRGLLPMCPADVRVLAWVKSFATIKKGVAPTYAWEPVIKRGGRNPWSEHRHIKDWILANPSIHVDRFVGAKPPMFCQWLFGCLGLQPQDDLVDLFPGTGSVGNEWEFYRSQTRLAV